ncbi:MAG: hypothetical protein ACOH2B_13705 [Burkholderiaceae bacterium]
MMLIAGLGIMAASPITRWRRKYCCGKSDQICANLDSAHHGVDLPQRVSY